MAGNGSAVHHTVVSKVAAILRALRFNGALTVTEIARVTDLPLSTAHRLVVELADWQLLGRGDDGRYGLAWGVARHATGWPSGIRVAAGPTVDDLSSVTARDVRLGVLDEPCVRYVEKTYGPRPLSAAATLPAHATALGQVLLAYSKADVVRRVVASGLAAVHLRDVDDRGPARPCAEDRARARSRGGERGAHARSRGRRSTRLRRQRRDRGSPRGAAARRRGGASDRRSLAHDRGAEPVAGPDGRSGG